jgi:hypothetical protein
MVKRIFRGRELWLSFGRTGGGGVGGGVGRMISLWAASQRISIQKKGERDRERQTERQRETERDRDRETERETERQRKRAVSRAEEEKGECGEPRDRRGRETSPEASTTSNALASCIRLIGMTHMSVTSSSSTWIPVVLLPRIV